MPTHCYHVSHDAGGLVCLPNLALASAGGGIFAHPIIHEHYRHKHAPTLALKRPHGPHSTPRTACDDPYFRKLMERVI